MSADRETEKKPTADTGESQTVIRPALAQVHLGNTAETPLIPDEEQTQAGGGIGLAIARRAVELHGGTIGACNAAAGGLVVTIRMPTSAAG